MFYSPPLHSARHYLKEGTEASADGQPGSPKAKRAEPALAAAAEGRGGGVGRERGRGRRHFPHGHPPAGWPAERRGRREERTRARAGHGPEGRATPTVSQVGRVLCKYGSAGAAASAPLCKYNPLCVRREGVRWCGWKLRVACVCKA